MRNVGLGSIADHRGNQHHVSQPEYEKYHNLVPLGGGNYTPGMYQDTSEFASGEDKTAGNQSVSMESFQPDFRGAVGHGHNHAISAEETVLLSPEGLLSNTEVVEASSETGIDECNDKSRVEGGNDNNLAHVGQY